MSAHNFFFQMLFTVLLTLAWCVEGTYIPYWVVEVQPHLLESQQHLISDAVDRLSLTNLGAIGSLKYFHEFHYPLGINGREYSFITNLLHQEEFVIRVHQQQMLPLTLRSLYHLPTDPEFKNQWPWFNTGQTTGPSGLDINVVPVWIQGVTGRGSTIAVIDDGVQVTHPDLRNNIDLDISFSFLTYTNDPTPLLTISEYSHGTSCAGEIIMVTDNGICGTGVAYNAKLGGIQFRLSDFRPSQQAAAFNFKNDAIQIYSNSYGPEDDGFTVGGPASESIAALEQATQEGRDGNGCIYVFSSGNGGEVGDSCAADGFINTRYIIGVGSANEDGQQAYYDENCAGKMATTYTYNSRIEGHDVVTTFVSDECVSNFTGTSASAPLVSGVIALGFEVNDQLSWRDVQYLLVYTSDTSELVGGDWITNGAGLRVSPQFGFGAIDAEAFVNRARYWKPVKEFQETEQVLLSNSEILINKSFPHNMEFTIASTPITYTEHVIFTVTFDVKPNLPSTECYYRSDYPLNKLAVVHSGERRGDAQITACSPAGTCSVLLPRRPRDFINCNGYTDWDLMSVHYWGENPNGNWTLEFSFDSNGGNAILEYLSVTVYGVDETPSSIPDGPCDQSCRTTTGCSSVEGSEYCDSCGKEYYRNVSTMECVRSCSTGACILEGTCVDYNSTTCPSINNRTSSDKNYNNIIIIVGTSVAGLVMLCIFIGLVVLLVRCCDRNKTDIRQRRHTALNTDDDQGDLLEYVPYK